VVVRFDPDASVPLLKAAGDSVIAAAVSRLVVAEGLAVGPAIASQITVQVAIGIRAASLQAVLISSAVTRTRIRFVTSMIMLPVAAEPVVHDSRLQRLLQTKRHKRLGRNIHVSTPGEDLSAGSRSRAKASP